MRLPIAVFCAVLLGVTQFAGAQAATPPAFYRTIARGESAASKPAETKQGPDVIVFTNGDRLTGKLLSAAGGNVVFQSDMAGQLTISFDKIKQLRSGEEFALLSKDQPIHKDKTSAPVGTVEIANQHVTIKPSAQPAAVQPASNVAYLIGRTVYEREMNREASFTAGWKGAVTAGATLVRSTTAGTTLTAGINLVRAIPDVPWLEARNRTLFDLTETYGKSTSPGAIPQTVPPTPSVTTLSSIFHTDAERDEYFRPTLYVLGDTAFDHNFAQGLELQQIYGGGFGWTVIKNARQELNLTADVHYEEQRFITTPVNGTLISTVPSRNLIGSTLFESYRRTLPRQAVLTATGSYLPAWNELYDYSGNLTIAVSAPVFKRLSATISSTDNYLNDPSPGYRRNTLQLVTGVTYTFP